MGGVEGVEERMKTVSNASRKSDTGGAMGAIELAHPTNSKRGWGGWW